MKRNVIFLTFILAFICTLSVVHSQTVEVQDTQHEAEIRFTENYEQASILVYEVDGSKKNLIKTISSDDYDWRGGYDVTSNNLYYANNDYYVMRMSFDTYEIENTNIQTVEGFDVTDDDSIICVSARPAGLPSIPYLYDLKTGEEIEIKYFPNDLLLNVLGIHSPSPRMEYDAELNGFTIEYYEDSSDPFFTGYISLDDFTCVETHLEMERPHVYYSHEAWMPFPSFDGQVR